MLQIFDTKSQFPQQIRENFKQSLDVLESVADIDNPLNLINSSNPYNNYANYNEARMNPSLCENMMMYLLSIRNFINTNRK